MKLQKNGIIAITFIFTFIILLMFSLLTNGFHVDIKGIFVAVYFAVWIAATAFVLLTFVFPFIQEKRKEKKTKKTGTSQASGAVPTPFKSPRSGLPIRERIAVYVTERRREDGLPTPEPLRPSRTGSAGQGGSQAARPAVQAASGSVADTAKTGGEDLGDIPLPDDFGSFGESSGDMGSLPGIDDDLGDMGGFDGSDDTSGSFGEIGEEIPASGQGERDVPAPSSSSEDLPDGGLPGFDGDIDSAFGESDLMPDDGMMDLSGDDLLTMDDDAGSSGSAPDSVADSSSDSSSGGLSEDGLPDLDDSLEPDILDSDLSGEDEFGDIEFMDLEPDEPKKSKK